MWYRARIFYRMGFRSGLGLILGMATAVGIFGAALFVLAAFFAAPNAAIWSSLGLSRYTFRLIVLAALFAPLCIALVNHFGARANSSL